jgi:hypothetical protein
MSGLLTTLEATERLGWHRSSLWRAERDGRISRATTVGRKPLWHPEDVDGLLEPNPLAVANRTNAEREDADLDADLASIRSRLHALAAGDECALTGTEPLRLMTAAIRRRLVLRTARGDRVAPREITDLMQLEHEIEQFESFDRLRDLSRGQL